MFKKIFDIMSLVAVLGLFVCFDATAGVQFLPGSGASGNIRASRGNPCTGYNLTSAKCAGKACSIGWNCLTCTNAKGKYYKCTELKCEAGYTAGKVSCPPCQKYEYKGFAGNRICGRCAIINGCLENAEGEEYTSFKYVIGVSVNGNKINNLEETGYRLK
ncbi:MAG: hypothetical protein IJ532_02345 [Alphaproteobacteria bacterium]|nr:hypothetical protein [Alphaproteobacteria bacterium]